MSYDTTVHEAIDPPQPRLKDDGSDRPNRRPLLRSVLTLWRPLAATSVTICTLFLVTWVVATLTQSSSGSISDSAEIESDAPHQEHVLRDGGE